MATLSTLESTTLGYTLARGCHSNDKMGYQARPWTYKKYPKHVFSRTKICVPKQV